MGDAAKASTMGQRTRSSSFLNLQDAGIAEPDDEGGGSSGRLRIATSSSGGDIGPGRTPRAAPSITLA